MERYIDLELLAVALGGIQNLPSNQELSKIISETEVNLLISQGAVSNSLIEVAWYLFTIASIKSANEIYGIKRKRAALQVAGHIFDLALVSNKHESHAKIRLVFASQIAYLKSQHQPNAIAIRKKHMREQEKFSLLPENYKELSLNCGVALLAFDIGYVYDLTAGLEEQATSLAREWGVTSLYNTPFGAAFGLALGCRSLINFLVYGRDSSFQKAKSCFLQAANCTSAYEDTDCIWMATLLHGLADELYATSIWKVLPADVPYHVKRAFTLGSPRVLSLWPPQIDYLGQHNPFADEARFQFLSTPTSGGKTLLAQVLIAHHLSTRLTSACYIAPTRSLCREVAASMKDRLRFLNLRSQIREAIEDFDLEENDIIEPSIDILTPESLAGLLRRDPAAVYNKYGLFVFDEVHAVGDIGRGWT
ncbi:MAG TPA: DEAD/DEAH box helicase, partial [Pseudobdellovibrionaceae bacterium]